MMIYALLIFCMIAIGLAWAIDRDQRIESVGKIMAQVEAITENSVDLTGKYVDQVRSLEHTVQVLQNWQRDKINEWDRRIAALEGHE